MPPICGMSFQQKPKKEIQKAADIPTKQWYTVKLNALVPVELRYKIQASSSDEAIEVVLKQPFKSQDAPPFYSWQRIKIELAKVYKLGTSILLKSKEIR